MRDKLIRTCELLSKPVDFPELERQGLISKAGAWYRVNNWKSLPEHVTQRICEVAQDSKGVKVKFSKGVEKTAAKVLKNLS